MSTMEETDESHHYSVAGSTVPSPFAVAFAPRCRGAISVLRKTFRPRSGHVGSRFHKRQK